MREGRKKYIMRKKRRLSRAGEQWSDAFGSCDDSRALIGLKGMFCFARHLILFSLARMLRRGGREAAGAPAASIMESTRTRS